jgi:hypothetical protein
LKHFRKKERTHIANGVSKRMLDHPNCKVELKYNRKNESIL